MSNSIWKTPEEKPKSFSFILEHHKAYDFDNHKVITAYNIFETGGNPQNPFDENTIRWCYLDELLAQADKAERLLAKVDWLEHNKNAWIKLSELKEEHIQRLQKAVDLALERFDDIRRLYDKYYDKYSVIATETTEEIKQLIKGK